MPFYLGLLLPSKATSISAGIAPYMALELASYDLMPSDVPAFAKGFTAALFATSICYPLDTVRCVWHQQAVYVFLHVSSRHTVSHGKPSSEGWWC